MSRSVTVLSLIVIAVTSWLSRFHGPLDLRWDSGAYCILGTLLPERKGYRLLNEPGEIETLAGRARCPSRGSGIKVVRLAPSGPPAAPRRAGRSPASPRARRRPPATSPETTARREG